MRSNFLKVWHFHSEVELVVILKSTGIRFIGDSIETFKEGELVLIGKNLPHMWMNDPVYFEKDSELTAEALVIHFREDIAGQEFWNLPEIKNISRLMKLARRGIKFNGIENKDIIQKVRELLDLTGFKKVIQFLQILDELASETDYEMLSSPTFVKDFNKSDKQRLEPVYNFIINNFKTGISLDQVAEVACMNPSAFSRYFKRVHRKTLTAYINELRVGYACKLLLEDKYSKTDICFECGFNNLSNFNRQFKSITSYSPSEYLKMYLKVG